MTVTEPGGLIWRVVDLVNDKSGHRAVAPGSDRGASHRYFVSDKTHEIRCYTFSATTTRELSPDILLQQLRSSIPGEWC